MLFRCLLLLAVCLYVTSGVESVDATPIRVLQRQNAALQPKELPHPSFVTIEAEAGVAVEADVAAEATNKAEASASAGVQQLQNWATAFLNLAVTADNRSLQRLRQVGRCTTAGFNAVGQGAYEAVPAAAPNTFQTAGNIVVGALTYTVDNYGRVTRATGAAETGPVSDPRCNVGEFWKTMYAADYGQEFVNNNGPGQEEWTAGHIIAATLAAPYAGGGNVARSFANVNNLNFFPQRRISNGFGNVDSPYNYQEIIATNLLSLLGAGCATLTINFAYPGNAAPAAAVGIDGMGFQPHPFYIPTGGTYEVAVPATCPAVVLHGSVNNALAAIVNPNVAGTQAHAHWTADQLRLTAWNNAATPGAVIGSRTRTMNWSNEIVLTSIVLRSQPGNRDITNTAVPAAFNALRAGDNGMNSPPTSHAVNVGFRITNVDLIPTFSAGTVQINNVNTLTTAAQRVPLGLPGTTTVIPVFSDLQGRYEYSVTRAAIVLTNLVLRCGPAGPTYAANRQVYNFGWANWVTTSTFNVNIPRNFARCDLTPTFGAGTMTIGSERVAAAAVLSGAESQTLQLFNLNEGQTTQLTGTHSIEGNVIIQVTRSQ